MVDRPSMADPLFRVDGRLRVKSMRQLFLRSFLLRETKSAREADE
jgi:hypothetical protein